MHGQREGLYRAGLDASVMVLCRWVVLGLLLGVQRASPADLQQAQSPSKMQVISSPLIPMQSGSLACATASAPFCYTRDMYPGEFFLHMHLTKCGGTSLYSLFDQSNCGQPTYSFDKARRAAAESVAVAIDTDRAGRCGFYSFEFESLPRLLEGIAASSSLPAGLVSEAKAPVRLLTVIRRPILQIMSLYRHIRKYLKYAKCRSIADIVSERCKAFNFRNMQVLLRLNGYTDLLICFTFSYLVGYTIRRWASRKSQKKHSIDVFCWYIRVLRQLSVSACFPAWAARRR